jgi:hypothetical protein
MPNENPGLELLDSENTKFFLESRLIGESNSQNTKKLAPPLITTDIDGILSSYIEIDVNTVILLRPLPACSLNGLKSKFPDKNIVAGLYGPDITENHIVTHFIPNIISEETPIIALDSKGPLNESFYNIYKPLRRKIIDLLKAPFQSLLPLGDAVLSVRITQKNTVSIKATSQGKQSLLDGVTCGIHNIQNILALANMSSDGIINSFRTGNIETRNLTNEEINKLYQADDVISFAAFAKSAWNNTFMKAKSIDEQNQQDFVNYFMGWPKDGTTVQKALYFLSLSFITTPVINTLKTLVQFPINFLSESARFLRNRLMLLSPTSLPAQFLRTAGILLTGLVENITKGIGFVVNAVTSPIENLKAAWKTNKALGVLSILISAGAYVGLSIFAAPIVLLKLGTAVPQFGAFISALPFKIAGLSSYSVFGMVTAAIVSVVSIVKSAFNSSYKSIAKDESMNNDLINQSSSQLTNGAPPSTYVNMSQELGRVPNGDRGELDSDFNTPPHPLSRLPTREKHSSHHLPNNDDEDDERIHTQ